MISSTYLILDYLILIGNHNYSLLTDTQSYGDVSIAPLPVQVALIHGLSLADEYKEALDVIARLSTEKYDHEFNLYRLNHIYLMGYRSNFASSMMVKSVALLLESAKRAKDYKTGAMIYKELWKTACNIKVWSMLLSCVNLYINTNIIISLRAYWMHQIPTLTC